MFVSTIAFDTPPGELAPLWSVVVSLALGVACWIAAGVELTRASSDATTMVSPPPVATTTAEATPAATAPAAARPHASAPPPLQAAVVSQTAAVTTTTDGCAAATGFAFEQGGATPHAIVERLDVVLEIAARHPEQTLTVEGYASAEGSPEVNLRLSHERAQAIARLLEKRGLAAERVLVQAYGEYRPSLQGRGTDEDRRVIVRFPGLPECPQETPP